MEFIPLAIITAIIAMAHKLNLKVVAEGVETREQALLLRQFNCDQIQGYWISRPLPPADIERLASQPLAMLENLPPLPQAPNLSLLPNGVVRLAAGVVSLPDGYGHGLAVVGLSIASGVVGVSANDLTVCVVEAA